MTYNPYTLDQTQVRQRGIMQQVYAWMTAGLLSTGAVALFTANSGLADTILGTPLFFGLIILELVMVFGLSLAINRMSAMMATAVFLAYAVVNGLTLSAIFLLYTNASIASTFFVTAGTFGAMSAYGYFTKRDLTTVGNLLVMALIGLILASLVNLFWQNEAFYWLLTYLGIAIFIGLTAWDTQKIKRMSAGVTNESDAHRLAIIGALMLYLDFINLFLRLLRILGRRR